MKHILIADDSTASRELICAILENAGYSVSEASNGSEVLAELNRQLPDLVLLDLQMPVMDGFTTVSHIRRLPQCASIPVIAVTASAMTGDRERALDGGFTGYITKPVRPRELRQFIRSVIPDA